MKTRTVFYGATVTNRSRDQLEGIVRRARYMSALLGRHGYQCLADVVLNTNLHAFVDINKGKIPDKYLQLCTPAMLKELAPLRMVRQETLKNQVACHYWGLEAIGETDFGIWDLTHPSTGAGFEITTALALKKKCFCFAEETAISSTISGYPSPLLKVSPYDDSIAEQLLSFFQHP